MTGMCARCGRALRACEWCGDTAPLRQGRRTWPVETREEWDGAYHEPCHDAEERVLAKTALAAQAQVRGPG